MVMSPAGLESENDLLARETRVVNDRPVLSREREPHINKPATA
jgi:hypothetical protein